MTCYLYFISSTKKNTPTKIGISEDVQKRLDHLQTANPYPLKCTGKIPFDTRREAVNIENYLHRRLRKCCTQGEWFDLRHIDLKKILIEYESKGHMNKRIERCDYRGNLLQKRNVEIERLKKENRRLEHEVMKLEQQIDEMLDTQTMNELSSYLMN